MIVLRSRDFLIKVDLECDVAVSVNGYRIVDRRHRKRLILDLRKINVLAPSAVFIFVSDSHCDRTAARKRKAVCNRHTDRLNDIALRINYTALICRNLCAHIDGKIFVITKDDLHSFRDGISILICCREKLFNALTVDGNKVLDPIFTRQIDELVIRVTAHVLGESKLESIRIALSIVVELLHPCVVEINIFICLIDVRHGDGKHNFSIRRGAIEDIVVCKFCNLLRIGRRRNIIVKRHSFEKNKPISYRPAALIEFDLKRVCSVELKNTHTARHLRQKLSVDHDIFLQFR